MTEQYVADYLRDIAFELLVISRCTPLMDTTQHASATYDIQTNKMLVGVTATATVGMTLTEAVDRLGVRPLAFGAAWKCLDILLEYALTANGHSGSGKNGRWHIAEKVRHARSGGGSAEPLSSSSDIWKRLTSLYVATEQIRHSLVHRSARTDATGNLVGVDEDGASLRPLSVAEQEAMLRLAQRTSAAMQNGALSSREETAIIAELDALSGVTGLPNTGAMVVRHPPVHVDVPVTRGQEIDLSVMRTRLKGIFPTAGEIDVRFQANGQTWIGHLEEVPEIAVTFVPEELSWLKTEKY